MSLDISLRWAYGLQQKAAFTGANHSRWFKLNRTVIVSSLWCGIYNFACVILCNAIGLREAHRMSIGNAAQSTWGSFCVAMSITVKPRFIQYLSLVSPNAVSKITAPRRAFGLCRLLRYVRRESEDAAVHISFRCCLWVPGGKACPEARAILLEISNVTQNRLRYRLIGLVGLGLRVAYIK